MKQRVVNKMTVIALAGLFVVSALAAEIDKVVVRQRWPWSRLVDIDYVLACDPTEVQDIHITAYDGTEKMALPMSSFSGDLYNVSEGIRRIVWDPMKSSYTNSGTLTTFNVELTASAVPLYMIMDLTLPSGDPGQIEYVYAADLHAGTWGSCETNPVTNDGSVIESLIWTGVTNDSSYATDKLVLRRVLAGSFGMGDNANVSTTLTKDFYAGVFEVTEAQWNKIMGGDGTTSKPKTSVSYNDIRGATNDLPSVNWPITDHTVVTPASFLGQLRSQTGIADFDLPTQAQWEYLCRAGTTTYYNDGNREADIDLNGIVADNNGNTNKFLNVLGWYQYNCTASQPVGQKIANAWGLYDTHGNVFEHCLDWQMNPVPGGVDPKGASSGQWRMMPGGCWSLPAIRSHSARRNYNFPDRNSNTTGFRLVMNL